MIRRLHPLALLAALAACATTQQSGELVWIEVTGSESCAAATEQGRFAIPTDEAAFLTHLRQLSRRSQGAIIGWEGDPPAYRCWTAAMFIIQRAGFRRLGFISAEPTPVAPVS